MSRVLIIDSELYADCPLVEGLRRSGHNVTIAHTGRIALGIASQDHFSAAFINLLLPDMAGLDVLHTLVSLGPTQCIVMSSHLDVNAAIAAMRLGARDYVAAPLSFDTAAGALHRLPSGRDFSLAPDFERHDLSRWAGAVVRFADSPTDAKNLHEFGRSIGASAGGFRNWCRTARQSPRQSLRFARALRLVTHHVTRRQAPSTLLKMVDLRTIAKFLAECGGGIEGPPLTVDAFLSRQKFICDRDALSTVRETYRRASLAQSIASRIAS